MEINFAQIEKKHNKEVLQNCILSQRLHNPTTMITLLDIVTLVCQRCKYSQTTIQSSHQQHYQCQSKLRQQHYQHQSKWRQQHKKNHSVITLAEGSQEAVWHISVNISWIPSSSLIILMRLHFVLSHPVGGGLDCWVGVMGVRGEAWRRKPHKIRTMASKF